MLMTMVLLAFNSAVKIGLAWRGYSSASLHFEGPTVFLNIWLPLSLVNTASSIIVMMMCFKTLAVILLLFNLGVHLVDHSPLFVCSLGELKQDLFEMKQVVVRSVKLSLEFIEFREDHISQLIGDFFHLVLSRDYRSVLIFQSLVSDVNFLVFIVELLICLFEQINNLSLQFAYFFVVILQLTFLDLHSGLDIFELIVYIIL